MTSQFNISIKIELVLYTVQKRVVETVASTSLQKLEVLCGTSQFNFFVKLPEVNHL